MSILPKINPQKTIFFSGAGISVDAPTNGPIGNALTYWALDSAFLPNTLEEIQKAYVLVGLAPNRMPRLEAILEIATQVHGTLFLKTLLTPLIQAPPNGLHKFFGNHLRLGGKHITANFDTFIEQTNPSAKVLHFHGVLSEDETSLSQLGARLTCIERGFDNLTQSDLISALTYDSHLTLIFVGYSGSDYFDVDPFFSNNMATIAQNIEQVFWINHNNNAKPNEYKSQTITTSSPTLLRIFQSHGVTCQQIYCKTTDALNQLAIFWNLDKITIANESKSIHETPFKTDLKLLAEASRRLYLHMGLLNSHEHLLREFPELTQNVDLATKAEIAWQKGDFDSALRNWHQLFPDSSPLSVARFTERKAACLWVKGSYIKAYCLAVKAFKKAIQSHNAEAMAASVETKARILIHMGRTPDICWFSTKNKKKKTAKEILRILDSEVFGAHTTTRLKDSLLLLTRDPESFGKKLTHLRHCKNNRDSISPKEIDQSAIETFQNFESLSAYLDYTRGQKRKEALLGIPISKEWLEQHCLAAIHLGKTASAATLFTLPGASHHYSLKQVLSESKNIQASFWHRIRLITRWAFECFSNKIQTKRQR